MLVNIDFRCMDNICIYIVTKEKNKIILSIKKGTFRETDLLRHRRQPPDIFPIEKLSEELIFKGALFLGAGLGLYVALRILGKDPPKDSENYIYFPTL